MMQIQRHLIKPTYKELFFLKSGNDKTKKVSKDIYDKLYDESWYNASIKVLPPITKELR